MNKALLASEAFKFVAGFLSDSEGETPKKGTTSKLFDTAKDSFLSSKGIKNGQKNTSPEKKEKDGIFDGFTGTALKGLLSLHPAGRAVVIGVTVVETASSMIGLFSSTDDNGSDNDQKGDNKEYPSYTMDSRALALDAEKGTVDKRIDLFSAMGTTKESYMSAVASRGDNDSLVALAGNRNTPPSMLDQVLLAAARRELPSSAESSLVSSVTRKLADNDNLSDSSFNLLTNTDDQITGVMCLSNPRLSEEQAVRILDNFSSNPGVVALGQGVVDQLSKESHAISSAAKPFASKAGTHGGISLSSQKETDVSSLLSLSDNGSKAPLSQDRVALNNIVDHNENNVESTSPNVSGSGRGL